MTSRIVDLSHEITHGMVTYPGIPGPEINDYLGWEESSAHYAEGVEFQIGRIDLLAATGTYLDTPAHRFRDGHDLADVNITAIANLPGVVIRSSQQAIDSSVFADVDVRGRAVLVDTGWSRHWATDRYGSTDHPFLTADAAEFLAEAQVALVGIDAVNIDDNSERSAGQRPVHSTLLSADILIVENLCNLDQINDQEFYFFAAPPKVRGMGSFTVRAFALQD